MPTHYVALDLETTGLNRETDAIIEIGAVRFSRDGVLDTFHTLVNPRRPLPAPVRALTGIADGELADAPPLETIAADFQTFLGDAALVGHNVLDFDAAFLDRANILHSGVVFDTQELAALLLPGINEYSLAALAAHFGIEFPVQHRALADAQASRSLFLALQSLAAALPRDVLGQVAQWLTPTAWPWRAFFAEAWQLSQDSGSPAPSPAPRQPAAPPRELNGPPARVTVAPEEPLALLASAATRADLFEDFDDRAVQREMVSAVTEVMNNGGRLIVEAGTGTGKSLAYLIPAACHALANDSHVVVSTATINLQEQLVRKDIPTLQGLLPQRDEPLRACQLKGRRNYLCLRRFYALRASASLTDLESLVASKVLIWLLQTETGDRAELRLSPEEEAVWVRLSADGADCTMGNSPFVVDGSCFLQKARRQADSAHVIVVNHSLLLSDTATGGHVLPQYDDLIVDEAHHLEDEASRQFGFRWAEGEMSDLLSRCEGIPAGLQAGMRGMALRPLGAEQLLQDAQKVRGAASGARPRLKEFCERVTAFLADHAPGGDQEKRAHLNHGLRVQPGWTDVEIAWENLRLALSAVAGSLEALEKGLGIAGDLGIVNLEMAQSDSRNLLADAQAVIAGLTRAIAEDDALRVVWAEYERDGGLVIAWVPLAVDNLLRDMLYEDKHSIVLTGATLRSPAAGALAPNAGPSTGLRTGFEYIQQRLGLEDAETLGLGSPFDYQRAALVLIPRDMPEPDSPVYLDALGRAVTDLARASQGRALVLFTSHAGLRAVHRLVSQPLQEDGINVLGQGIDGSPRQLVRALKATPNTVLLGTASFWEGVDIPGDALSLLVIARLPFAVPTDPVFAARSDLYEDPFSQFALPQAILRFKQGFGRLIRTKTDRGVLVVLDQRIVSKSYGPDFLNCLPPCTRRPAALREMPDLVEGWLAREEVRS